MEGSNIQGYRLYWGKTPGSYTESLDVGLNTTYELPVDPANPPYVVVRARNAAGESDDSNEVRACDSNAPKLSACPDDSQRVKALLDDLEGLMRESNALRDALATQTAKTAAYIGELRKQEAKTVAYANFGFKYRTEAEGGQSRAGEVPGGEVSVSIRLGRRPHQSQRRPRGPAPRVPACLS